MHVKFCKKEIGAELEEWGGLFINAGRRGCGSLFSRREKICGAGAKTEQPVCEQAGACTLGGLQELKLLTLFAKYFHIQVGVRFNPILMDFDRQRPNEPQAALLIGKDSNDKGAAFELLIDPLEQFGLMRCL